MQMFTTLNIFNETHAKTLNSNPQTFPHTLRRKMSFAASARSFWNHPAGPKTIFFWAPTMKWGITAANVKDFSRPPELLSVPQQTAVTVTGLIWCKYALDITPVNYNLMAVNMVMAATGSYQLYRRFMYDSEVAARAAKTPSALEGEKE